MMLTFLSFFAAMGGFALGLRRVLGFPWWLGAGLLAYPLITFLTLSTEVRRYLVDSELRARLTYTDVGQFTSLDVFLLVLTGEYELTVRLSQATALSGVTVRLIQEGDAMAGDSTGDHALAPTVVIKSEQAGLAASDGDLVLAFAPGQTEHTLRLLVFHNPERIVPRTLRLTVVPSSGVRLSDASTLAVTLAGTQTWVYLPLIKR